MKISHPTDLLPQSRPHLSQRAHSPTAQEARLRRLNHHTRAILLRNSSDPSRRRERDHPRKYRNGPGPRRTSADPRSTHAQPHRLLPEPNLQLLLGRPDRHGATFHPSRACARARAGARTGFRAPRGPDHPAETHQRLRPPGRQQRQNPRPQSEPHLQRRPSRNRPRRPIHHLICRRRHQRPRRRLNPGAAASSHPQNRSRKQQLQPSAIPRSPDQPQASQGRDGPRAQSLQPQAHAEPRRPVQRLGADRRAASGDLSAQRCRHARQHRRYRPTRTSLHTNGKPRGCRRRASRALNLAYPFSRGLYPPLLGHMAMPFLTLTHFKKRRKKTTPAPTIRRSIMGTNRRLSPPGRVHHVTLSAEPRMFTTAPPS